MKKISMILLVIGIVVVFSATAGATMQVGKDSCGGKSMPCTSCHTAVPKKGDADKKLKPKAKELQACKKQNPKKSWEKCCPEGLCPK
jgi:hypothetical protein